MSSMRESRKLVDESLRSSAAEVDHDAVLASLQEEIDKHNAVRDRVQRSRREGKRDEDEQSQHRSSTSKFRFKRSKDDREERRSRRSRRHREEDGQKHRKKRKHGTSASPQEGDAEAAHPFPREPADPTRPDHHTDDAAFRDSLFDALADDEGAAYWESVYSQPIHVYSRPTVQTEKGELEQMSDAEYTAYVKTKMWERKHPEIVLERERSERKRREEEEERVRQREEFVRRKEQAAWDRAQRGSRPRPDSEDDSDVEQRRRYEYKFAGEKEWSSSESRHGHGSSSTQTSSRAQRVEYAEAWTRYLAAWDTLKHELLQELQQPDGSTSKNPAKPSKRIPWPTLASKPVIKANIEDFMRHAPFGEERSLVQMLKAERVRWHPDKVQQRFGGGVDEGTMKIVTGVFQVVDGLLEEERKRGG